MGLREGGREGGRGGTELLRGAWEHVPTWALALPSRSFLPHRYVLVGGAKNQTLGPGTRTAEGM